jgi:hypothetical protein
MSYPFLFRHEGEIYCVPETSEAREVALYQAERFPYRWTRVCTLLADVAALDPTLFQWEGRWWLMCTHGDSRPQETLFIYYSHSLRGPWAAHRRNPVVIDIRSARPAGTPFLHRGALYRPAQDCSGRYGGSITVTRVLELSPASFRQEIVRTVRPDLHGPYRHGMHTLSAAGDITLVDGCRLIFSRRAFTHQLQSLARMGLGALRRPVTGATSNRRHAQEAGP